MVGGLVAILFGLLVFFRVCLCSFCGDIVFVGVCCFWFVCLFCLCFKVIDMLVVVVLDVGIVVFTIWVGVFVCNCLSL